MSTLWPAPALLQATWSPRGTGIDYLALPGTGNPRLLVPVGVPGSDRSLVRHGDRRRTRAVRSILKLALRSGSARWLPLPRLRVVPDPDGIEQHLRGILGEPVQVAVLLGPPRPNLKPVLQVFAPDGATVAYAKVATNPLTEGLLATEASALRRIGQLPLHGVAIPQVLDFSSWRDTTILVQSALPRSESRRGSGNPPARAIASIATSLGVQQDRVGSSEFWRRLPATTPADWHGLDVSAFATLRKAVDTETMCGFGAWHGDFAPWNSAQAGSALQVWDWERFETDVPIGMDAAHWRIQSSLKDDVDPGSLWPPLLRDVGEVQRLAGSDTSTAPTVVCCYLLAIWARYRRDATGSASAELRVRVERLARMAQFAAAAVQAGSTNGSR